jgi:hypothetical protein
MVVVSTVRRSVSSRRDVDSGVVLFGIGLLFRRGCLAQTQRKVGPTYFHPYEYLRQKIPGMVLGLPLDQVRVKHLQRRALNYRSELISQLIGRLLGAPRATQLVNDKQLGAWMRAHDHGPPSHTSENLAKFSEVT